MGSNTNKNTYRNAYRWCGKRRTTSMKRRIWLSFSGKKIEASGGGLTMSWERLAADQYAECWLNLETRRES
jgi:hypothetical protein